jgi:hypothetical protein
MLMNPYWHMFLEIMRNKFKSNISQDLESFSIIQTKFIQQFLESQTAHSYSKKLYTSYDKGKP